MTRWNAIRWPQLAAAQTRALSEVLLDSAADDGRSMGFAPDAYARWLADALAGHPAAGRMRAELADEALRETSLASHLAAVMHVARLRRRKVRGYDDAAELMDWSDAEVELTVGVAQLRADDPSSPRNRLATLGKAAGTLGHELRNPLGVIQSSVYLLRRNGQLDENTRRHVDKVSRQASICHRIVEDLMHLARNAPPRLESVDVAEAFSLAIEEAALSPATTVHIEPSRGARVPADPGLLQRALVNLLRNAETATARTGNVWMGVRRDGQRVSLWIRDDGPGFAPELRQTAFNPLTTTGGIGLGLALVDSVMRRHGGTITAENVPSAGARVTLHFPMPDVT